MKKKYRDVYKFYVIAFFHCHTVNAILFIFFKRVLNVSRNISPKYGDSVERIVTSIYLIKLMYYKPLDPFLLLFIIVDRVRLTGGLNVETPL